MWKSKFYGAFVLNRFVNLHSIDAMPARWRGDVGSSPLDRASTAASSPSNELVKNHRVHPTHWLISTPGPTLPPKIFEVSHSGAKRYRPSPSDSTARTCVEINQCVGCTKSFLGDDVAALAPSSGEEPAPPRHRAGVASMA